MHTQHPVETWPDELRRFPEIYHPDGRRIINNNELGRLFGITDSAVRERRRQGRLPQSIYKDGNRHFSDLQVIANIYLDEFPGKVVEPAPPGPTDITLTGRVRVDRSQASHPTPSGAPDEADEERTGITQNTVSGASDRRQELRQYDAELRQQDQGMRQFDVDRLATALERLADIPPTDPAVALRLAESVEGARNLFEQILTMEKESDGQLTALSGTVQSQARIIEEQQAEIRRLREASEKASEQRQGFWERLFGKR